MIYDSFIKSYIQRGLIKEQEIGFDQIIRHLARAKKDLVVAKANIEIDEEATYNYAYLAMLRCGRAIMFLNGFRPSDGQQHKTVIEFCREVFEQDFIELIRKFDMMRRKRNQFTYDPFLPVSKTEAENALNNAEMFVDKALEVVRKRNPQAEFNF